MLLLEFPIAGIKQYGLCSACLLSVWLIRWGLHPCCCTQSHLFLQIANLYPIVYHVFLTTHVSLHYCIPCEGRLCKGSGQGRKRALEVSPGPALRSPPRAVGFGTASPHTHFCWPAGPRDWVVRMSNHKGLPCLWTGPHSDPASLFP